MSDPAAQGRAHENIFNSLPPQHLLPVPYSVRPDRLERGIRMLRALRLSLAAQRRRRFARASASSNSRCRPRWRAVAPEKVLRRRRRR